MSIVIGETPGNGVYICTMCGFRVTLKDGDELEQCPICDGVQYNKIK